MFSMVVRGAGKSPGVSCGRGGGAGAGRVPPDRLGVVSRRAVAEHRAAIAELLAGLRRHEVVPVKDALGRVTVQDVTSAYPVPLFDNSQMDGFAVRAAEISPGEPVPVSGRIFAGDPVSRLAPGTAAAIMTGAPMPDGGDAVVPVEVSAEADGEVRFDGAASVGDFVRRAGEDVAAGEVVVGAGTVLAPRHLGALAAAGVGEVRVAGRPRVAVLSTGSELVASGETPRSGQIFESNSVLLTALVTANGGNVVHTAVVGDDGGFPAVLADACTRADLVLTSGGISKGEREPVRTGLAGHGWFGVVAMQPGGPQGLATFGGTPVCCFPGNPVSVLVSFEMLLRDVVRGLAGLAPIRGEAARLACDVTSPAGRTQFRRGRLADGVVDPVGGPGSHLAVTAAAANVLIEIDAGVEALPGGSDVTVWRMT